MIRAGIAPSLVAGAFLALAAGCPAESPNQPDAGESVDAMEETGGLMLVFQTQLQGDGGGDGGDDDGSRDGPSVWRPGKGSGSYFGTPPGGTVIQRVELELDALRAVGDAVAGDAIQADFVWGQNVNRCLPFRTAQPGKYSQVKADVVSYRIEGTTSTMNNATQPFVIDDSPRSGIAISIDVGERTVGIGQTTFITVFFQSLTVATVVDWDTIPADADGGPATVNRDSPVIDDVRRAVAAAMVPADQTPDVQCTNSPDGDRPSDGQPDGG